MADDRQSAGGAEGRSLVPTFLSSDPSRRDAYYNRTEGLTPARASGVAEGTSPEVPTDSRVTLSVPAPGSPTTAYVAVKLVGPDSDTGSLARLRGYREPVEVTLNGPASLDEGQTYTLNLAASNLGADTLDKWVVTWGDGSVVTYSVQAGDPPVRNVTHTYTDGLTTPTISVRVETLGGRQTTATKPITVNNVPPTLTISGPAIIPVGATYTLNLSSADPGDDTITQWNIDWGDSTGIQTVTGNPSSVTHLFTTRSSSRTSNGGQFDWTTGDSFMVLVPPVEQFQDHYTVTTPASNVAAHAPLPAKPRHRSEGITPEQIAAFIATAMEDRLFAMYLLAIDGGLRQGELLGLTWKDVDTTRGTVRVSKALEEVGGELTIKAPKTPSSIRTVRLSSTTKTRC